MKRIEKGYIAQLDILGFKKLCEKNSHVNLEEIYSSWVRDLKNELNSSKKELEKYVDKNQKLSKVQLHSIIISDSIVLWTDDTSYSNFFNLIVTVRFMLLNGILSGIPLRGAISCGPISILQETVDAGFSLSIQTFVGKPISDSYELGNCISMSGCVIDENCINEYRAISYGGMLESKNFYRLQNAISIERLEQKHLVKTYPVKIKTAKGEEDTIKNMLTVNWVSAYKPKIDSSFVRNSLCACSCLYLNA